MLVLYIHGHYSLTVCWQASQRQATSTQCIFLSPLTEWPRNILMSKFSRKILAGCPVTFGVKNIGQVQKYRFFEVRNIG